MGWVRSLAFVLSAALHAALFIYLASQSDILSLENGKGSAGVTVAIPISIENGDFLGLNERNAEASEAVAPAMPPDRERQEPEKHNPDSMTDRVVQTAAAETSPPAAETNPTGQVKRPAEDSPAVGSHTPQRPAETQQEQEQASHALEARRKQLSSLYHRDIFMTLLRHRVDPHSGRTGRVVVLATIASSGELVTRTVTESSGSDVLDRAALATVDKSAPFPAIPRELGSDPMTLRVPFEYSTR
jgi:protein TonB